MHDSLTGIEKGDLSPFLISGPCVIESKALCLEIAGELKHLSKALGITIIFKASYDKANRSSSRSFRGPGLKEGLAILKSVKEDYGIPILTDIHQPDQARVVAEVADVLQIPAFLCRQTDLLESAAITGRVINIKKGQFMAPEDMKNAVMKIRNEGNEKILLTERGTTFGYHDLVVDFRGIAKMKSIGCPVIFDATHSVQSPGGLGDKSGGQREMIPILAKAASALKVDGFFFEVHPNPDSALSDGPNSLPMSDLPSLVKSLLDIWKVAS